MWCNEFIFSPPFSLQVHRFCMNVGKHNRSMGFSVFSWPVCSDLPDFQHIEYNHSEIINKTLQYYYLCQFVFVKIMMQNQKSWSKGVCSQMEAMSEIKAHDKDICSNRTYVPTEPQAYSQSNTGMASEQERESPWVAQPKLRFESHLESVERLEDFCSPMFRIQLDRAWPNLQGKMGGNPQIQMCKAVAHILN